MLVWYVLVGIVILQSTPHSCFTNTILKQADIICDASGSTEAEACPEGYVCEEASNSEESVHFPCREGYVCDFGTTPDPDLEAPEGQFTQLCPVGFVCTDATGLGQAYRQVQCRGEIGSFLSLCNI